MTVAVSSQSSDTGERISNLLCSNNECTPADNSSASHLSSYWGCIINYDSEFAYRSCNFESVPESLQSYRFCALRENGVFCSEVLNVESEIPSACRDTSMCTSECRAALQSKYGCCLNIDFLQLFQTYTSSIPSYQVSRELKTIWEICKFEISETCQLAIPRLSESLPTTKCPESDSQYTLDGICKNHLGYTQELVDEAFGSTCSQSKLLGLQPYFYCENSEDLGYCIFIRLNSTLINLFTGIREVCSISSNCSFECQESLLKAKKTFGCCANALIFFQDGFANFGGRFYSCEVDGNIWGHCGISQPDFCSNSLVLNGHGSFVDTSVSVIFAAILMALSCFT